MTFQLTPTWYHFEAYHHLSPSQWLLHPSQRNYYRKMTLENRCLFQTQLYQLFRKWLTCHVTFQLTTTWYHLKAYRLLSPSQWLLHPSQRNYYIKLSLKHRALILKHLYRLFQKWITGHVTFQFTSPWYHLKLTVFLVHLNGFYTHVNAIAIKKMSL